MRKGEQRFGAAVIAMAADDRRAVGERISKGGRNFPSPGS
jgi:hypothetical protein